MDSYKKKDEEKLNSIKVIYDNIKQVNININKKLSENIIKTAKSICTLRSYGKFFE